MQNKTFQSTGSPAILDKGLSDIKEHKLTLQLKEFLTRKGVDSSLFTTDSKHHLTIKSKIEEHSAWLYKNVMPKSLYTHSILHANRCAFLVPVFINALRICGNKAALSLKEDKVSLWQITTLCHDIAREGDGEDHWDLDSGLMLYYYLTYVLKHDHAESVLLAEAIANKDWEPDGTYHQLVLENEELVWKDNDSVTSKPLANIVIHDCDSLDIARVHHFSVFYLDFYKNYATNNPLAFFILNRIIFEWKSLLITQGDFVCRHDFRIKDQYICEESYSKLLKCIFKNREGKESINEIDRRGCYKVLPLLYFNRGLLAIDDLKKVTHFLLNLQGKKIPRQPKDKMYHTQQGLYVWQRFANQGLLVRGMPTPSYLREKELKYPENQARLELDKTRRRNGFPTRTKKLNRFNKHGNKNRSAIWIAEDLNCELFCSQGYLSALNLPQFKTASIDNMKSGTRKKTEFVLPGELSAEGKSASLSDLKGREQMGGLGRDYKKSDRQHHEIIADFTDFIGILWTSDHTLGNSLLHGNEYPVHRYSPLILAVFLQKEYELVHHKKLPIFEYSFHGYFKEERINDDILLNIWQIVIHDYLKDQLALGQYAMILNSVENLKLACIYGNNAIQEKTKDTQPADSNYTDELQKRVSAIIQKEKSAIIKKAFEAAKIQLQQNRLTPDAMFFLLAPEVTSSELQQYLEDKFYFHVERLGFYQHIFQLSTESLSVFNYIIRNFRTMDGQINEDILNGAIRDMVDVHNRKPLTSEEEKLVAEYREEIRLKNPSDSLSLIPVSFLEKLLSFLDGSSGDYKSIHQGYQKGLDLFLESKINNPSFQILLQSELVEWQIAYQKGALKLINFIERAGLKETIGYTTYEFQKILENNKALAEKAKVNFLSECHGKLSTPVPSSQAETLCSIGFLNRKNSDHQGIIRHIFQFFDSTPLESETSPPDVSDLPTASTS
jgi:hypothetical protein